MSPTTFACGFEYGDLFKCAHDTGYTQEVEILGFLRRNVFFFEVSTQNLYVCLFLKCQLLRKKRKKIPRKFMFPVTVGLSAISLTLMLFVTSARFCSQGYICHHGHPLSHLYPTLWLQFIPDRSPHRCLAPVSGMHCFLLRVFFN
jgi:hypothetical protein